MVPDIFTLPPPLPPPPPIKKFLAVLMNWYYVCFFPGAWVHATIQRISKYYIFQVLTFYDWNFLLKFRLSTVWRVSSLIFYKSSKSLDGAPYKMDVRCIRFTRSISQKNCIVPFNVSGLYNLGTDTLQKPRDKIAWVSATLHGWLKALLF